MFASSFYSLALSSWPIACLEFFDAIFSGSDAPSSRVSVADVLKPLMKGL